MKDLSGIFGSKEEGNDTFVDLVREDAANVRESHVSSEGSDRGWMPAFNSNIARISSKQEDVSGPSAEERWNNDAADYDVELDLADINHSLDNVKVWGSVPGLNTEDLSIGNGTLHEYIDEVKDKLSAVSEAQQTNEEAQELLDSSEEARKHSMVDAIEGEANEKYQDRPGDLTNSNAASEHDELQTAMGMASDAGDLLEQKENALGRIDTAFTAHARNVADQYHADAKENIQQIAEGAEDAMRDLTQLAAAASAVTEQVELTRSDTNYDEGFGALAEGAVDQAPVLDAAYEAIAEAGESLAEYMSELQAGVDEMETVAERFGEYLDTEEVQNMEETVQEYRQGMVDLAERVTGEHFETEEQYDNVGGYVMDMLNEAGFEQGDLEEDDISIRPADVEETDYEEA